MTASSTGTAQPQSRTGTPQQDSSDVRPARRLAYLGIGTSSWVDLALVAGEVAVIAALAISILVKVGPVHYSAAVLWPASSPNGQITDVTNALIYCITTFAGFETAAALGEEARNARRSIPASTIGIVIVTGLFYVLVVCAETFGVIAVCTRPRPCPGPWRSR